MTCLNFFFILAVSSEKENENWVKNILKMSRYVMPCLNFFFMLAVSSENENWGKNILMSRNGMPCPNLYFELTVSSDKEMNIETRTCHVMSCHVQSKL